MRHIKKAIKFKPSILGIRIILSVLIILIMLIIKLRSAAGDTAQFKTKITDGGDTVTVINYLFEAYNEYTGAEIKVGESSEAVKAMEPNVKPSRLTK